jgi:hypothetical protein
LSRSGWGEQAPNDKRPFNLVGLRQKTNREKPQPQSPLGIDFEKPKIAETQIYQGKSQIEVNPLSGNGLSLFC